MTTRLNTLLLLVLPLAMPDSATERCYTLCERQEHEICSGGNCLDLDNDYDLSQVGGGDGWSGH